MPKDFRRSCAQWDITSNYCFGQERTHPSGAVVLSEEMTRLKKLKTTMDPEEQKHYVKRWKMDNKIFLNNVFGLTDLLHLDRFLKGVLFAPCSSKHLAPLLQDVFQADGAHSNFGKYTLFSVLGPMQTSTCLHLLLDYSLEMKIKQTGPNSGHL
jgi:hypothetical protein